ncbi:MAG: hypothetical protein KC445_01480 [Anaerolineales bacterium]|nr:hypothetical protein [Anaerolineales bacterium]
MNAKIFLQTIEQNYPGIWEQMEAEITAVSYFNLFKQLSDNYSPTLTVSRVQGPLVESLLAGSNVKVDRNLRKSGSIGLTIGQEPAPIWLSGHADICSYLTGPWDGTGYPLTPFCMPRARPGGRPAVALGTPENGGALARLAEGEMVTTEAGDTVFATQETDLPPWTRVVYHLAATWDQESDKIHGYIDNQATCAALILATRVLSQYNVNVLLLLNDEEEGPVDKGNQGFSRAMRRLLHRTPHNQLPDMVIVSDGHMPPGIDPDDDSSFVGGQGALLGGLSSGGRGAVVPPQLIQFARELAPELAVQGIKLSENPGYISRSDDISAMQYTQNVMLIGFAGTSSHFDLTPTMHCHDLVHLTKTFVIYALLAQDAAWRAKYL